MIMIDETYTIEPTNGKYSFNDLVLDDLINIQKEVNDYFVLQAVKKNYGFVFSYSINNYPDWQMTIRLDSTQHFISAHLFKINTNEGLITKASIEINGEVLFPFYTEVSSAEMLEGLVDTKEMKS